MMRTRQAITMEVAQRRVWLAVGTSFTVARAVIHKVAMEGPKVFMASNQDTVAPSEVTHPLRIDTERDEEQSMVDF